MSSHTAEIRERAPVWARDWLAWFLLLVPFLSALGIASIVGEVGEPYGGFVSYNRARLPNGEVDANTPEWWAGMIGDRVRYADTLLTADGQTFFPNARTVFQEAAAAGARTVTILLERAGIDEPIAVSLPVVRFSWADVIDLRLPDWISALSYWLLAIIVYVARPTATPNRAFAIVSGVVAITRANYVHSLFIDDHWLTLASEIGLLAGTVFTGLSLLYFGLQFPKRWERMPPWTSTLLVAIGVIISVPYALSRLPVLSDAPWLDRVLLERLGQLFAITMLGVGLLVMIARLLWLLRGKNMTRRERNILAIVGVGWLISLPLMLVTIVGNLGLGYYESVYNWAGLDLRYLLQGAILAFAFVLVRYQAFQAPSRLFLFVVVISGSALLAALGAWLWTFGFPNWPENGLRPPFFALFLAASISGLFWISQGSWDGIFGRILHRERTSYSASRDFGRRVMGQTDMAKLPQTITEALIDELQLDQAAIWMRHGNGLKLVAQSGERRAQPPDTLCAPDASGLVPASPIYLAAEDALPAWLEPLADHVWLEIAVPLLAEDELIGLLALGQRWDEEIFDDRDLEVAELIGQQATLFLVAAQSVNELRHVPGRMADVQEQERTRLAQELHDTIQQFLGRLPFYLAVSRDSYTTNPEQATDLLNRSIDDVEDAARSVRQIRHNLAPSQLQSGLTMPLMTLVNYFQNRTGLQTTLTVDPDLDHLTTLETRHALYRVIQQALDNVEMHAGAKHVTVQVHCDNGQVVFSVDDDGRGSSAEERASAVARGSFGLQSMRARIESCDGQLLFRSAPGGGTGVGGWVPAVRENSGTTSSN